MKTKLSYDYEHYASTAELPEADRTLVAEAERATRRSHAPYSKFRVGAAARLASGKVLHAGNFESEVFPAGLCAERSLLFYVQTNYPDDPIETLAIASDPSPRECYPCGQCRQVMVDVERRQGRPMYGQRGRYGRETPPLHLQALRCSLPTIFSTKTTTCWWSTSAAATLYNPILRAKAPSKTRSRPISNAATRNPARCFSASCTASTVP